jgi:hypothetical protein
VKRFPLLMGLLTLGLISSCQAQLQTMPPEGLVLNAGQRLRYWMGGRVLVGKSVRGGTPAVANMQSLLTKPPRGVLRLERNRRYYRKKELEKLQGGTIGKGILTELLYKKGRQHSERSKARSEQGKGSKSALKSIFRGLFK